MDISGYISIYNIYIHMDICICGDIMVDIHIYYGYIMGYIYIHG